MRPSPLLAAALPAALLLAGCRAEDPALRPEPADTAPGAAARPVLVEIVGAPGAGSVAEIVLRERSRVPGRPLLVYVGASWCEPCQRFHQAVLSGQADALFPGLRLLEFDLDVDRERLQKAGYTSRMIPLFALPREDGTASGKQIEGSIKGPGALAEITPRLEALLANP
jgi:thiol-disulfide isomerase/thioredoxin